MNMTIWDIETGPETDERLALAEPAFEAPGNYKDPEKIAANIAEQRVKWSERAALDPMTGRVLAIGYLRPDEKPLLYHATEMRESEIVENFFSWVRDYSVQGSRLVGFNIHGFDLPFIVKRAWILGVPVPPQLRPNGQSRFYWPTTFVDLQQVWGAGDTRPAGSLATICKLLGLGEKTGSGADFARLYADPATREQALEYLRFDLKLCSRLAERLLA